MKLKPRRLCRCKRAFIFVHKKPYAPREHCLQWCPNCDSPEDERHNLVFQTVKSWKD